MDDEEQIKFKNYCLTGIGLIWLLFLSTNGLDGFFGTTGLFNFEKNVFIFFDCSSGWADELYPFK